MLEITFDPVTDLVTADDFPFIEGSIVLHDHLQNTSMRTTASCMLLPTVSMLLNGIRLSILANTPSKFDFYAVDTVFHLKFRRNREENVTIKDEYGIAFTTSTRDLLSALISAINQFETKIPVNYWPNSIDTNTTEGAILMDLQNSLSEFKKLQL